MRVKVGDRWFDSVDTPLIVQLSPEEKRLIRDMRPEDTKLCLVPRHLLNSPEFEAWTESGAPPPPGYEPPPSLSDLV